MSTIKKWKKVLHRWCANILINNDILRGFLHLTCKHCLKNWTPSWNKRPVRKLLAFKKTKQAKRMYIENKWSLPVRMNLWQRKIFSSPRVTLIATSAVTVLLSMDSKSFNVWKQNRWKSPWIFVETQSSTAGDWMVIIWLQSANSIRKLLERRSLILDKVMLLFTLHSLSPSSTTPESSLLLHARRIAELISLEPWTNKKNFCIVCGSLFVSLKMLIDSVPVTSWKFARNLTSYSCTITRVFGSGSSCSIIDRAK